MAKFIAKALLLWRFLQHPWAIEVSIKKDIKVVEGTEAELVCQVSDLKDPLEDCYWVSPLLKKYYYGSDHIQEGVIVDIDAKRDECILKFYSVRQQDSGAWECVVSENRDKVGKWGFVKVHSSVRFQVLLDHDQTQLVADRGNNVQLICPSTGTNNVMQKPPICMWYAPYSPKNMPYVLMNRYGSIGMYLEDGIQYAGNPDKGDCGISIRNISFKHYGEWQCVLIRKRVDAAGSEVARSTLQVLPRTARLIGDEKIDRHQLQGFTKNQQNVKISLNITIDDKWEKFTRLYWMVQRIYIVNEGEKECHPVGRRNQNGCYTSTKREKLSYSPSVYSISLTFDVLTEEDLEEPVVLIKEYHLSDSKDDKFQEVLFVPHGKKFSSIDEALDDTISSGFDFTDGNVRSICRIRGEIIDEGDDVDFPDLCVKLLCKSNGNVDVQAMREDTCSQRQPNDDSAGFQ